jgi:hypothetical protein
VSAIPQSTLRRICVIADAQFLPVIRSFCWSCSLQYFLVLSGEVLSFDSVDYAPLLGRVCMIIRFAVWNGRNGHHICQRINNY